MASKTQDWQDFLSRLSVRARNGINYYNRREKVPLVCSVRDLRRISDDGLLALPNFGRRTLAEIRRKSDVWVTPEPEPVVIQPTSVEAKLDRIIELLENTYGLLNQ